MSTFNASHSGMWQNLPRDDGGRTTALLILMACRERPLFGPVVPAEVDNLRRQLQQRKVVQFGGCTHVAKMLENRVRALGTEI